jgi:DNA-binding MarR family transcriptional regulator
MAYSPESAEQDTARVPESDGDRAVAYRNVLDVARERPDASLEAVADEVDDVSTPFVERVLEEFGDPTGGGRRSEGSDEPTAERSAGGASADPGRDLTAEGDESDRSPDVSDEHSPGAVDVTPEQRAVLRAVYERPTATRAEVAERVGASRATVSAWLDEVSGFDWASRRAFVETVFGDGAGRSPSARDPAEGESERDRLAALEERVERLESRVTDRSAQTATGDVETVRQRLHACLDADHISQDAELRIVRRVVHETEGT